MLMQRRLPRTAGVPPASFSIPHRGRKACVQDARGPVHEASRPDDRHSIRITALGPRASRPHHFRFHAEAEKPAGKMPAVECSKPAAQLTVIPFGSRLKDRGRPARIAFELTRALGPRTVWAYGRAANRRERRVRAIFRPNLASLTV